MNNDLLWVLFFIPFTFLAPMIGALLVGDDVPELLKESFAKQEVAIDGECIPATELEVVHRWLSASLRTRSASIEGVNAQWLCKSRQGAYLLAVAAASGHGKGVDVRWTWRRTTEARAKSSLIYNVRAYRRVFGEYPNGVNK